MANKDPYKEIMSNIDWTRLVPILQPLIIFGAWIIFSKFDNRADSVSKLIAIAEPIPALDLNVPRPIVLASLYHSIEDALEMLNALSEALEDLGVATQLQNLLKGLREELLPDPAVDEEVAKDVITQLWEFSKWFISGGKPPT